MRVKNSKILLYVMLDLWSGGGSECDNREFTYLRHHGADFPVFRTEIMAPLRNTVSLVNRKERNLH